MVCNLDGNQMRQKVIGKKPVGYGYATETDYLTVTVQECTCGNLVLEEYRARKIDLGYANWILRNKGNLERGGDKNG